MPASHHRRGFGLAVAVLVVGVLVPAAGSTAAASPSAARARPAGPAKAPAPAAIGALPANSTYARQILQALDPAHGEPARADVVRAGKALDAGASSRSVVTVELLRPGAVDARVRAIYTQVLDRDADPSGLGHWRRKVQTGTSLERVTLDLATSNEAQRNAGPSDDAYVDWAYRHLLGRVTNRGGRDYWTRRLDSGTSRRHFANTLIRSSERARRLVDATFDTYLRRPADQSGGAYWTRAYAGARIGELDLIAALLGSAEARGSGCDPTDGRACLLPFPNDRFTVPDPVTATGRRVAFKPEWMPANASGKHVDPTEWNRNDGFSVGQAATVKVPGLDLVATGAAPLTDIGSSLDPNAPIVVLDATTGERHPYFAELDANVTAANAARDQLLYVRPAVNYVAGHRYVIALRHLKKSGGATLAPPSAFLAWRDHTTGGTGAVADQRPRMERLFGDLAGAGVARNDLYLAWDFTVASVQNTTGRSLSIRDRALASLGGRAPAFTVSSVTPNPAPGVARRVEGTFSVPLYLTGDGSAGNGFKNGADGLPVRNGTYQASFDCELPSTTVTGARAVVYGHGLFGSHDEVRSGPQRAMVADHDMAYCATDWIGMSDQDVGNAAVILGDVSTFNTLVDRSQQGILNTIFLGRLLMTHDGFASAPAFRTAGGAPLVDTSDLFYDGNSQGAVIGGAYLALSPDTSAGVLGVAGMNYSTLLERSVDFDPFFAIQATTYPNRVDQVVGLDLIQMLWDRGETDGYAAHLAGDVLPGSHPRRVLLHAAVGDHQVANLTAEIEARTAGMAVHRPAYAPGRSPDVEPAWDLPPVTYPSSGSALVIYDSGSPLAPLTNTAPRAGRDPHQDPRNAPTAQQQKSAFLATGGTLIDVCGTSACTAPGG